MLFAAGVEDLGILTLLRRHREDDRLGVRHLLFVELGVIELLAEPARQHPGDLGEVAHLLQLLELVEVIRERQAVLAELFLELFGLRLVVLLLGLLDEGEHIAHAEDA